MATITRSSELLSLGTNMLRADMPGTYVPVTYVRVPDVRELVNRTGEYNT